MSQICLNKSVLKFMASVIDSDSYVLEYGAGFSTPWFAKRCGVLVSVEHDPKWAQIAELELVKIKSSCFSSVERVDHVESFIPSGIPDLVLVDCLESARLGAAIAGWGALGDDGWIVFDDAQRPVHEKAVKFLDTVGSDRVELVWKEGDVPTAKDRLTLAWKK